MPIYSDKTLREGGLKNQKKLQGRGGGGGVPGGVIKHTRVHVSVNIVYQTNTNANCTKCGDYSSIIADFTD